MVRAILDWTLPFYLSPCLVLFMIYCVEYYHQPIIHIWLYFVFIPMLDLIFPEDNTNPTEEEKKILENQVRWHIPVFVYVLIEWITTLWSLSYLMRTEVGVIRFLLLAINLGMVNSEGILISHELCHKKNKYFRLIGVTGLVKSLNMHFFLEHLYGHHKYVATPEDPATSKLNQTVFEFSSDSMKNGFINAWNREAQKMKKKAFSVYSLHNRMIQFITTELSFCLLVLYFCGFKCFLFFIIQAYLSSNFLESVNYVRHYGLQRKKLENGEYEPVTTKHSWNAPQIVQNFASFKLQRHSDHHANSYKPYQILHSSEDAPCLPCGYSVCIIACNFPSFWFGIMNPLVEATNKNGKPTDEQMKQSSSALTRYMMYHVSVLSLVAYGIVSMTS